jgi:hypothetical protein
MNMFMIGMPQGRASCPRMLAALRSVRVALSASTIDVEVMYLNQIVICGAKARS